MKSDVIVIGGGASGMMAAIAAARKGAKVTILEQNDRLGKKLLSTGNGKCNYTNENQDSSFYHSECPERVHEVLRQFPLEATLSFFKELGVLPLVKKGGYYPNSEQASAVLDALRFEVERLNVSVKTNTKVKKIEVLKDGFRLSCEVKRENQKAAAEKNNPEKSVMGKRVILAAGSRASAISGSDGSGYQLAKKLGHRIITPLPALVQLRCQEDFYRGLQGVRMQAKIQLSTDEKLLAEDAGELQLTGYGVSGIPVFQVSRFAARTLEEGRKVRLVIDFLPNVSTESLKMELKRLVKRNPMGKMEDLLTGMVNKKLAVVLLKCCGIKPSVTCNEMKDEKLYELAGKLKAFGTKIMDTNGFREAQVCSGGIDLSQVKGESLESCKVPGVYFAGECLDVDGACGGYNLQWAWASGFVAGSHAAE